MLVFWKCTFLLYKWAEKNILAVQAQHNIRQIEDNEHGMAHWFNTLWKLMDMHQLSLEQELGVPQESRRRRSEKQEVSDETWDILQNEAIFFFFFFFCLELTVQFQWSSSHKLLYLYTYEVKAILEQDAGDTHNFRLQNNLICTPWESSSPLRRGRFA